MNILLALAAIVGFGAIVCLLIYLLKPEPLAAKVEQWNGGIEAVRERHRQFSSYWAAVSSAFLWVYAKSRDWSASRPDRWLRIGLQCGLLAAGSIAVAILTVAAVYVVLVIAVGYLLLKLFSSLASDNDEREGQESAAKSQDEPLQPMPGTLGGRVISRVHNFGGYKYTVHTDTIGNKLGESHVRRSLGMEYVEHLDAAGNKLGETNRREFMQEEYLEHRDTANEKHSESREREWAGEEYTEHRNRAGDKIGESRPGTGPGGGFTDHRSTKS